MIKRVQIYLIVFIISSVSFVLAEDNYQIVQVLSDKQIIKSGDNLVVFVEYNVSNGNKMLTGIGFRLHYNSKNFELLSIDDCFSYGKMSDEPLIINEEEIINENPDDGDQNTDKCIVMGWSSVSPSWPYTELPLELLKLTFKVKDRWETSQTSFNITLTSKHVNYGFKSYNREISIIKTNSDINNDGYTNLIDVIQLFQHLTNL